MVKIRLRRVGAKKQPSYRVVVADSRAPRDGRFIESIGHYNPRAVPPTVVIYEDRALYWLSVGAVPSEPVARFFEKLGLAGKLEKIRGGAAIDEVAAPRTVAAPAKKPTRARPEPAAPVEPAPQPEPEPEPAAAGAGELAAVAEEAEVVLPGAATAPPEEAAAATAPPAGADVGLEALGLSSRVAKALEAAGLTSAAAIQAKLQAGDAALLEVPGIGAKAVEEIRAKLVAHGFEA
jgi:small subunit ribosomal protein S16